ncbi:endonuclease domain-containing protein [Micromonospora sp. NPDC023956]|uniref:endonuclease domain-containing protein n=1 Tax=Micromonospora sp. NPDC023956 TaxID=3155722 RepID=UPI0033E0834A
MTPAWHRTHNHRFYRLTCEDYDERFESTGNRCELCGVSGPRSAHRQLYVDHCPQMGPWAVRGLLCGTCNTRLGGYRSQLTEQDRAYLAAKPWIAELCAREGRPILINEPRAEAVVLVGPRRRRFRKTDIGWAPERLDAKTKPRSWESLHQAYGPRQLAVGLSREQVRRICRAAGL